MLSIAVLKVPARLKTRLSRLQKKKGFTTFVRPKMYGFRPDLWRFMEYLWNFVDIYGYLWICVACSIWKIGMEPIEM
jgi:hypothetical protein